MPAVQTWPDAPHTAPAAVAAAGAGQYALAKLGKAALRKQAKQQEKEAAAPAAQAPAQLPAAPAPAGSPPRESAKGGGMVVELFRDTAADLELLEEDQANGIDDEDEGPIEIDLDEAA